MTQNLEINIMVAAGAVFALLMPSMLSAMTTAQPSTSPTTTAPPAQTAPTTTAPQAGTSGTTPAPSPATATQTARNDPNKMVCRRVQLTGSRLAAPRVCRTQAEWDAAAAAAASTARNMQSTGVAVPPGGS